VKKLKLGFVFMAIAAALVACKTEHPTAPAPEIPADSILYPNLGPLSAGGTN
jgi:hypothetical protein